MKVLFVEPPKEIWFVMGEYLPPPYGIIQLAAYLEKKVEDVDIQVLDCNAEQVDWEAMAKRIESFNPDVVASSSLATCNTYVVTRTLETAKKVNPGILTVTGGQHFTATAEDSMQACPEIDVIVRGEGEQTFAELVEATPKRSSFPKIDGISFRHNEKVYHNPPRPLIENLDGLPYPGYHLVKDQLRRYHFTAMAGRGKPYALIEGSRGCSHECTFCTQWQHWQATWRSKSARRIADEMEYCYSNFGGRFIWLTDDNLGAGTRASDIADEILKRGIGEDVTWFVQARCDDIIRNKDVLPKLHRSGLDWVLLGVENSEQSTLESFRKGIAPSDAKTAVKLLRENGIFAQAMLIIGQRKDTSESISRLKEFVKEIDPDLAIFAVLTPFPGTEVFDEAKRNGWIEDQNWSHYDMVHAIMPTETLSRAQVQEELYGCYRSFYGSWQRRIGGIFSSSKVRRRVFRHMASRGILSQLKSFF